MRIGEEEVRHGTGPRHVGVRRRHRHPAAEAAVENARDKAGPVLADARDKAAPLVTDARDQRRPPPPGRPRARGAAARRRPRPAGPLLAEGKALAAEKAAVAATIAADKAAEGRDLAAAKVAELRQEPEPQRSKIKTVLVLGGILAVGAAAQEAAPVAADEGQLAVGYTPAAGQPDRLRPRRCPRHRPVTRSPTRSDAARRGTARRRRRTRAAHRPTTRRRRPDEAQRLGREPHDVTTPDNPAEVDRRRVDSKHTRPAHEPDATWPGPWLSGVVPGPRASAGPSAAGRRGGAPRPRRRSAPTSRRATRCARRGPSGISARGTSHQRMTIVLSIGSSRHTSPTVSRWSSPVCATITTSASGAASSAARNPPGRGASTWVIRSARPAMGCRPSLCSRAIARSRRAGVKLPPSGKITNASLVSSPAARAPICDSRSSPAPGSGR